MPDEALLSITLLNVVPMCSMCLHLLGVVAIKVCDCNLIVEICVSTWNVKSFFFLLRGAGGRDKGKMCSAVVSSSKAVRDVLFLIRGLIPFP